MTGWTPEALAARVRDRGARLRHPAASPDPLEVEAYAASLGPGGGSLAVVLGMTPELRQLAVERFRRVISVDASRAAINLYRDWLSPSRRSRETIIQDDWSRLDQIVPEPPAAVLADGAFGNLADETEYRRILAVIAATLAGGGRLVTRQAVIPLAFRPASRHALVLRDGFRRGQLDEAEFGFAVRLLGHYSCCYDADRHVLDNAKLFSEVAAAHQAGVFTDREASCINRYRFEADNCILPQARWEEVLNEAGFTFRRRPCEGRDWYGYYIVYESWLNPF